MEPPKTTVEDLTSVRKRLQVEVAAVDVQAEIDRAFQQVGARARLRGFRPGKAPRPVLEQFFGEQVRQEVLGRLVEESLQQAIATHRLAVVGSPDVDAEAPHPGDPLRYSAIVDVRPVITLGDLSGIAATRPSASVSEEQVGKVLHELRESVARVRPAEGRHVVESGDVVTVDLASRIEGGEPQRREGVLLEAGGGAFALALERQIVGQPRGAALLLDVPYPADYGNPALAGKRVAFEVEIKDLGVKELPALDDELARDHGRCDSLEELRGRIRQDLEEQARHRAEGVVRDAILGELLTRHAFDVPPSLVLRRADALLSSLDMRLPEGPEGDRMVERLRVEVSPRAEQDVRAELLLDAIAAQRSIEITDAEIDAEIDVMAVRERQAPERLRAFYGRPEARMALRARMVRERALRSVLDDAKIVPAENGNEIAPANQSR